MTVAKSQEAQPTEEELARIEEIVERFYRTRTEEKLLSARIDEIVERLHSTGLISRTEADWIKSGKCEETENAHVM